jgi:transposase InsO family protein
MAINRAHHEAPPAWSTDRVDVDPLADEVKFLLYEPTHPHRYWFIDFRYLVRIGEDRHWVYSLLILEGYSRKILAGMACEHQDVVAVLQLLNAALLEYGAPEGMVSDNGSVFTSDAYEGLLGDVGIEVCHIEKGKPWQTLIEAQFKVELRLADAKFEQATTLEEIQERHATFVELFNTTPHWGHRKRKEGHRTPVEVLTWMRGRNLEREVLQRALRQLQMERVVTLRGYVSVQRFYLYAERGLSRKRVSVWLREGRLDIAYQDAILAQYAYRYDRKARRLQAVDTPRLFQTPYRSPRLEIWELDDEQWRKIARRPYERSAVLPESDARQLALASLYCEE